MKNIFDIISNQGDRLDAYVTKNNRQVITIKKGDFKVSAVRYSNGRIVETRSYPENRGQNNLLEQFD